MASLRALLLFASLSLVPFGVAHAASTVPVAQDVNAFEESWKACIYGFLPDLGCQRRVVRKYGTVAMCKQIHDSDGCLRQLAQVANDPSICEQTKFSREECYGGMALQQSDPELCKHLSEDPIREECILRSSGAIEAASKRSEQFSFLPFLALFAAFVSIGVARRFPRAAPLAGAFLGAVLGFSSFLYVNGSWYLSLPTFWLTAPFVKTVTSLSVASTHIPLIPADIILYALLFWLFRMGTLFRYGAIAMFLLLCSAGATYLLFLTSVAAT